MPHPPPHTIAAIVTGGSLGIGAAISLSLAREGCNVAINYRRHDTEAKEIVARLEAMGRRGLAIKADVQSYADAERMVQTVVDELGSLFGPVGSASPDRVRQPVR